MKKVWFITLLTISITHILNAQSIDTLTIGQYNNCNFKTITAAVDFINDNTIQNKTILLLTKDYNPYDSITPETFPIVLKNLIDDDNKSLIITPDSNVEITFTDSTDNVFTIEGIVELRGKNRIHIISNCNSTNSSAITINDSPYTNITIDSCNIYGGTNSDTTFGIFGNGLGQKITANSYITITNNSISRANVGISLNIESTNDSYYSTTIDNNDIGDVRDDYMINRIGIESSSTDGSKDKARISNNNIFSIIGNHSNISGINISGMKHIELYNNLILDIVNESSIENDFAKATGLKITSVDTTVCYNNMISHIAGQETYGIKLTNRESSISEFYYNSVYLCEDNSNINFGDDLTTCFFCDNVSLGRTFLKNNILQNSFGDIYGQTPTTSSCLMLKFTETEPFEWINNNFFSNHNIYYINDLSNGYTSKCIERNSDVCQNFNLGEWNEINNDTTCVDTYPGFTSTSLLKIEESNAIGIPIDGITSDFFGTARNNHRPDAGACEIPHETGSFDFEDEIDFTAYYSEGYIKISSDTHLSGYIYIFDMSGRAITSAKVDGKQLDIKVNDKKGIYVVSYIGLTKITEKIIIK